MQKYGKEFDVEIASELTCAVFRCFNCLKHSLVACTSGQINHPYLTCYSTKLCNEKTKDFIEILWRFIYVEY
jgi:hypothetical protein